MQTDIKFQLWITINTLSSDEGDDNWNISWCIHNCTIYDEKFFIEGYPIKQREEEGKTFTSQTFSFNKKLLIPIGKFILPRVSYNNGMSVSRATAWDYWTYLTHLGFTFNVHPVSMSDKYFRMEYIGTQGQIYNKCLRLYNEWISKNKNLIK